MSEAVKERLTGAEDIIWDLSVFYQSHDDPQIEADIAKLYDMVDEFQARWRGRVTEMSAADFVSAYEMMEAIYDLRGRVGSFAFLNFSTDTGEAAFQAAVARMHELEAAIDQKMVFSSTSSGMRWRTRRQMRSLPSRGWPTGATTWMPSAGTNPII